MPIKDLGKGLIVACGPRFPFYHPHPASPLVCCCVSVHPPSNALCKIGKNLPRPNAPGLLFTTHTTLPSLSSTVFRRVWALLVYSSSRGVTPFISVCFCVECNYRSMTIYLMSPLCLCLHYTKFYCNIFF